MSGIDARLGRLSTYGLDLLWSILLLLGAFAWLVSAYYPGFWGSPSSAARLTVIAWTGISIGGYGWSLFRLAQTRAPDFAKAENRRWLFIGLVALFLLQGFVSPALQGGGDARWYGTMLADMVAQTRSGVFPVWLGQSPYQFNGAIYPIRVAPAFHYLGALLDTLTFHSLGIFALQNLLLLLIGLAGIFSCYFALASLLPEGRRGTAAGLAVLYLACPGVLGLAYNSDLYMSWTTVPLIPLVWAATVKSFRNGGSSRTMILLGLALGLCWWGHSPIALWTTFFALCAQAVRLITLRGGGTYTGWGLWTFVAVAAYPVGSVLLYPPEPGINGAAFQSPTSASVIAGLLRQVWPATILPLSENGRALSDFQVGYTLWAILIFVLWTMRRVRRVEVYTLTLAIIGLVLLLNPVSYLNTGLWTIVPGLVREITARWVMNRLYLPLAGAIVFACAAVVTGPLGQRQQRTLRWLLTLGCIWSVSEAKKFSDGSHSAPHDRLNAPESLPLENVMLTRYAYFVFPKPPAYFTDGVTDPNLENRLLRESDQTPLATNFETARAVGRSIADVDLGAYKQPSGDAPARFQLTFRRHYLLSFQFLHPEVEGVLQIKGTTLFRQYALPDYGSSESFGAGNLHSHLIPVDTSNPAGEAITLRFIPSTNSASFGTLARVSLIDYSPSQLPVKVSSWIPYQATVTTPVSALLESPRMYQRGYTATVNGITVPVFKSREGLAAVQVPAGTSVVRIGYHAPIGLDALFAASLGAIVVSAGALGSKSRKNALVTDRLMD